MDSSSFKRPGPVRCKALSLGDAGIAWMENLCDIVRELQEEWQIQVGSPLTGGPHAGLEFRTAFR